MGYNNQLHYLGGSSLPMITTWDAGGSYTITLPLTSGATMSGSIDWGDGITEALTYANRTHTYATNMTNMFYDTPLWTQDISSWNVSNVTNMSSMFKLASNFDEDLSNWDISNVANMTEFMNSSGLTTANYDNMLNAWSLLTLQSGYIMDFGTTQYTIATSGTARSNIVATPITINDGGGI